MCSRPDTENIGKFVMSVPKCTQIIEITIAEQIALPSIEYRIVYVIEVYIY